VNPRLRELFEQDQADRAGGRLRPGADERDGRRPARWLAAAAQDRWLMAAGRPQRYGTQYRSRGGRWELWPVDEATSDDERAAWDVPPLAEARRRAEELTRDEPPW
jgi:hypothetical protein